MRREDALSELDNAIMMFTFMSDAVVKMTDSNVALNNELVCGMQQIFFHIENQFKDIRDALNAPEQVPAIGHAPHEAGEPHLKQSDQVPSIVARNGGGFSGLNCFEGFAEKIGQCPPTDASAAPLPDSLPA